MSHTSDLVGWDEHQAWYRASLATHSRLLVICEQQDLMEKVAVVRFDVMNGRALISINLSPKMRGRGLAKACLRDAIIFFETIHNDVRHIDAEIKSANVASQRSFADVGFTLVSKKDDIFCYELVI